MRTVCFYYKSDKDVPELSYNQLAEFRRKWHNKSMIMKVRSIDDLNRGRTCLISTKEKLINIRLEEKVTVKDSHVSARTQNLKAIF